MAKRIWIRAGSINIAAELNDSPTASAILSALPIKASAQTWGDEIYFSIPVGMDLDETAREVVERGDLGYWPSGKAFCIFFGPTPASHGEEIRPASAVNVVGKVLGDSKQFKRVLRGDPVLVEVDS